jgi:hypothetical protein
MNPSIKRNGSNFGWASASNRFSRARLSKGTLWPCSARGGCGKSAMQQVITEVLGGREFNPMESWLEGGRFNSGLSGAEHWKIEDSAKRPSIGKTRGKIGAYMKQAIINVKYRIEKKGKDSLSLKLFPPKQLQRKPRPHLHGGDAEHQQRPGG